VGVVGAWLQSHALRFHAATVDALPEELLAGLIAHELGHAYFHARRGRHDPEYDPADPFSEVEREVQLMVEDEWGFPEPALSEWLRAHPEVWAAEEG
jgi:predicted SprT family Zn-dependent metalloprotease